MGGYPGLRSRAILAPFELEPLEKKGTNAGAAPKTTGAVLE